MRMEGSDMKGKDEALKSHIALRCAKAASLLASLKSSPNRDLSSTDEEKEKLWKEIKDLKVELVRERLKSKSIKLCALTEVALVMVLLSLSSYFLMLYLFEV